MEYISAHQAAEKWGISLRRVQELLKDKRVDGAVRPGRDWLIPADALKPGGPRRADAQKQTLSADLARLAAATVGPWPAHDPDAILAAMPKARLRLQYEGELAYLRGDFARVVACFGEFDGDDAAKLRACPLTIAASICIGNYALYTEIEAYLHSIVASNAAPGVKAVAELALATAYVSAIAPRMVADWLKAGDFSALPPAARTDAAYKRAKYFEGLAQYESALAVAETALALSEPPTGVSFAGIYLRLTCGAASRALGRMDAAARYLQSAMRIALPHGFITPFAESAPAYGGLVERLIAQEYPASLAPVLGQWQHTFAHWMAFHNRFTKDNITAMLTLREYQLATQVARRVPRAQIARQFHLSTGRLNNIMKGVYGRLFIAGREELAQFIL